MSVVETYLIEKNFFFREGLKSLLDGTDFRVCGVFEDIGEAAAGSGSEGRPGVILAGEDGDANKITETMSALRKMFPESRIAILVPRGESELALVAFRAGADGYILKDMPPAALLGSLNMIAAGEKICPAAMLCAVRGKDGVNEREAAFGKAGLSVREKQILEGVAAGESNKQIARNLNITEATVKVHVKAVLRKLDLSNRTQAAVWAVNRGLVGQETRSWQMENLQIV